MGFLRRVASAIRHTSSEHEIPILWEEWPTSKHDAQSEARDPEMGIEEPPMRLSFLLRLPFDLPVPQNSTATMFEKGFFVGWEDVRISPFPGLPPWPEPGLSPGTSLWLRRTEVPIEDPVGAISDAFGDEFPKSIGRRRWRKTPPLRHTRAIAQVTRIAPATSELGEEADEQWLSDQFDQALRDLNEFLVVLASVTGDAAIGPITKQELPPALPFFLTSVEESAMGTSPVGPSLLLLHVGTEAEGETIAPERFGHVGAVQARHRGEGHPFFPYAEAIVSARRSLLYGRAGQAALEAATAAELLITTVVREVGALRAYDAQKLQNIIRGPFRSRIEHHLGPMIGLNVGLSHAANEAGAWFADAYELRNEIVHTGYRPTMQEARRALAATRDLMAAIGRALHADPVTRGLGEMLVSFEDATPRT